MENGWLHGLRGAIADYRENVLPVVEKGVYGKEADTALLGVMQRLGCIYFDMPPGPAKDCESSLPAKLRLLHEYCTSGLGEDKVPYAIRQVEERIEAVEAELAKQRAPERTGFVLAGSRG